MKFKIFLFFIFFAILTIGYSKNTNPIFQKSYWKNYQGLQPEDRIVACKDTNLIKQLNLWYPDNSEPITSTSLDSIEQQSINHLHHLIKKWPKNIGTYFWKHVAKVFIVDDYHYSGRTIWINNQTFIIIVNKRLLSLSPNEWIKDKEYSSFGHMKGLENLSITIDEQSSPSCTIEGILIHELGHVIALNKRLIPYLKNGKSKAKSSVYTDTEFPAFKGCITRRNSSLIPGGYIEYYQNNPEITYQAYHVQFQQLSLTSFPTMYSTIARSEYFAELFYSEFHCHLQGKPYKTVVTDSLGNSTTYLNGILEKRCNKQHLQMQSLIQGLK